MGKAESGVGERGEEMKLIERLKIWKWKILFDTRCPLCDTKLKPVYHGWECPRRNCEFKVRCEYV